MLVELSIENLVLIERAALHFGGGLNVITGETGAGKSLLIDALELLLGQRARSGMVRRGADKARVEGRFSIVLDGYGERVAGWLRRHLPEIMEDADADVGSGELELILTRTLTRDGRTRAHVNHRPVTQRVLRELTAQLVEIHGQNDHQRLFEPPEQLRLLDTFAELDDARAGYRERRTRWFDLAARLDAFESQDAERLQRLDLLRFQASELAEARPAIEERDQLREDRERLRHADELGREIGSMLDELSESDTAALDSLRRAERVLEGWEDRVGALAAPAAGLREAVAQLEESIAVLRTFFTSLETDSGRLEEVEGLLDTLERLERKHRTDSAGLANRLEAVEAELAELEADAESREELAVETGKAYEALAEAGRRLDRSRGRARGRLKQAVERGLAELGLAGATFDVELRPPQAGERAAGEPKRFGPDGISTVEFLLAANPGESREPLRKVASGGEVARIMLALRGALAVRHSTPTLVFDEVDSGVGGRLGPKVGAHLRALGAHHQILCVTHLPAIAAQAVRHMRVCKEIDGGRTRTQLAQLSEDDRVAEIADMIAGGAAHDTALAEARRLLADV